MADGLKVEQLGTRADEWTSGPAARGIVDLCGVRGCQRQAPAARKFLVNSLGRPCFRLWRAAVGPRPKAVAWLAHDPMGVTPRGEFTASCPSAETRLSPLSERGRPGELRGAQRPSPAACESHQHTRKPRYLHAQSSTAPRSAADASCAMLRSLARKPLQPQPQAHQPRAPTPRPCAQGSPAPIASLPSLARKPSQPCTPPRQPCAQAPAPGAQGSIAPTPQLPSLAPGDPPTTRPRNHTRH